MQQPALGGSYILDPDTGERRRVAWTGPAEDTPIPEAPAGGTAGGRQAEPGPIKGAPMSEEPVAPLTEPAPVPAAETGEAEGADPAAAPDAVPSLKRKRS